MFGITSEPDQVADALNVGLEGLEWEVEVHFPLAMQNVSDSFQESTVRRIWEPKMNIC